MGQYPVKTKCYQYEVMLQRIRSLLDEIKAIKRNETTGICDFCKRYNSTGKCKRCEILSSKYGIRPTVDSEKREERFKIWLFKVKQFLYMILEREVCKHKLYHGDSREVNELKQLLYKLKTPLNVHEPYIGNFPSIDSLENLSESKDILEEVLMRLRANRFHHTGTEFPDTLTTTAESPYYTSFGKPHHPTPATGTPFYTDTSGMPMYNPSDLVGTSSYHPAAIENGISVTETPSYYPTTFGGVPLKLPKPIPESPSYYPTTLTGTQSYQPSTVTGKLFYQPAAIGAPLFSNAVDGVHHHPQTTTGIPKYRTVAIRDPMEPFGEPCPSTCKYFDGKRRLGQLVGEKHEIHEKERSYLGRDKKQDTMDEENINIDNQGRKFPPGHSDTDGTRRKLPLGSKLQGYGKLEAEGKYEDKTRFDGITGDKTHLDSKGDKSRLDGKSVGVKLNIEGKPKGKADIDGKTAGKGQLDAKSGSRLDKKAATESKSRQDGKSGSKADIDGKLKEKSKKVDITEGKSRLDTELKSKQDMKSGGRNQDGKSRGKAQGDEISEGKIPLDDKTGKTQKGVKQIKELSTNKEQIDTTDKKRKQDGVKERKSLDEDRKNSNSDKSLVNKSGGDKRAEKSSKTGKKGAQGTASSELLKSKSSPKGQGEGKKTKEKNPEDEMLERLMKSASAKGEGKTEPKNVEKPVQLPKFGDLPDIKRKIPEESPEVDEDETFIECGLQNEEPTEMVKGTKVIPIPTREDEDSSLRKPMLFKIKVDVTNEKYVEEVSSDVTPEKKPKLKSKTETKNEAGNVIYALSDREYIDKGWTILPTTIVMRKMNIYKMLPANSNSDWFERNKRKGILFYDCGEKLAEVNQKGGGRWFYKNGHLALDYYPSEEEGSGHRYVIYSSGERSACGAKLPPVTVLASFDHQGNGIVYDHYGNERLKYNQSEGIVIDDKIGPPGRWKWHTLNEPPVLQPVFVDTHVKTDECVQKILKYTVDDKYAGGKFKKEPNLDMLTIELENVLKEKANKLLQEFKPFQIKMKACKINDQFSLKVIDQSKIYLMFRDGPIFMKINVGMLLISNEIVGSDQSEVSKVATPYDRLPPKSQSILEIQNILHHAKMFAKNNSKARY